MRGAKVVIPGALTLSSRVVMSGKLESLFAAQTAKEQWCDGFWTFIMIPAN